MNFDLLDRVDAVGVVSGIFRLLNPKNIWWKNYNLKHVTNFCCPHANMCSPLFSKSLCQWCGFSEMTSNKGSFWLLKKCAIACFFFKLQNQAKDGSLVVFATKRRVYGMKMKNPASLSKCVCVYLCEQITMHRLPATYY